MDAFFWGSFWIFLAFRFATLCCWLIYGHAAQQGSLSLPLSLCLLLSLCSSGNLTWQQLAPNPAQYGLAASGNAAHTVAPGQQWTHVAQACLPPLLYTPLSLSRFSRL